MRTSALLLCLLAAQASLSAELSGVVLPDTLVIQEAPLVLNGLGQRKKAWIEVYVAGLYLPSRTSSAQEILSSDGPWCLVMQFVYSKVDKEKLDNAWMEGFSRNSPSILSSHREDVQAFLGCFQDMRRGERVVLAFTPGQGLAVEVAGVHKRVFPSPEFAKAVLSIWLGPKPPSEDLKKGLLGLS